MQDRRSSTRNTVRRYRHRRHAKGLRQIQLWVPDTRSPAFGAECRPQSLLVAGNPAERAIMDQLETLQDTEDWR